MWVRKKNFSLVLWKLIGEGEGVKSKTFGIGVFILILGVLGFLLAQDITDEYQTTGGQLVRGLSEEEQQNYETWMGIKYGSAFFGLIGFGLTLYGGLAEGGKQETKKTIKTEPGRTKTTTPKSNYCRFCGEKIPPGADYCPSCGKEI
ncbi:hypothetical protein AKJ43_03320 [candidate division MSBL1 archaeon SCGC-AAA261D19]|uniref:Zinc-ribbon domain-containing protein n=1 Tax=candidate division MSBL1 archaeon SCGC-AAA261D19 TaxID=1698273 RepID=A0A133V531_9EURY|nr:hypothetical protein AKJ43_03320 [candidate division MSBL1 archaeon SCGC-AAA261D19]